MNWSPGSSENSAMSRRAPPSRSGHVDPSPRPGCGRRAAPPTGERVDGADVGGPRGLYWIVGSTISTARGGVASNSVGRVAADPARGAR